MRLSGFRRKKHALRWVWWVVIVVLGAGMLLLFVNPPTGVQGIRGTELANVDGCSVGVLDFRRRYAQTVDIYRQQFGENFERFQQQLRLGDQTLNSLISECAIAEEAKRLGLSASTDEIRERVLSLPVFRTESGHFVGKSQYERILQANNLTWEQFEEGVRREILRNKLLYILTDGIEPQPSEVRQQFASQNQEVKVRYVAIDKENLEEPEISDEELKKYFEDSGEKFKLPEKRKIKFVRVPIASSKVEVSEEQIQAKMEEVPDQTQIRASHILFKVKPDGDDSDARRRAAEVLKKLKAGADFAEMARQYSEDTSASQGGDLGFFGRGRMVPEFEKAAFSLKTGEMSGLVKSPFGIHIIKVTSAPRSSQEARRMVAEFQVREEEAGRLAKAQAEALAAQLRTATSIEEAVAGQEGLKVQETDFFALGDRVPELAVGSDFNQQVFALQKGEVTDPYLSGVSYVVARLEEVQPARMPQLDAVRDKVIEDYQLVRREELANQRAKEIYQSAVRAGSLEKAAEEKGMTAVTTDFFKSGSTVDDTLKFSPVLHERAFAMDEGEVSPAITVAGKLIVFEVVDKTPIDEGVFEEKKDEIASQLKEQKRNSFFVSYVQNVVDQLRKNEKIEIDRELLDSLTS